jgi:hypothetical protein
VRTLNCRFNANSVDDAFTADGGGLYVSSLQTQANMVTPGEDPLQSFTIHSCDFEGNRVVATGSGGGGGMALQYSSPARYATTSVRSSRFSNNGVSAPGAKGGGIVVVFGPSARGTTESSVAVGNTSFVSNYATHTSLASGAGASGSGGGLHFESMGGVALSLVNRTRFVGNEAGASGGAVAAMQQIRNTPSNINMAYLPAYDIPVPGNSPTKVPALCYSRVNSSNGTNVFREYSYAALPFLMHEVLFDSNRAGTDDEDEDGDGAQINTSSVAGSGAGGALYVADLRASIRSSNITSNADVSGAARQRVEEGLCTPVVLGLSRSKARRS